MAQAQGTTREWDGELPEPVELVEGERERGYAEVDVANAQFVLALMEEAVQIVARLGGVVAITGERAEVEPGVFATTHLHFKWDSYGGPAKRLPREEQAAEPEAAAA